MKKAVEKYDFYFYENILLPKSTFLEEPFVVIDVKKQWKNLFKFLKAWTKLHFQKCACKT